MFTRLLGPRRSASANSERGIPGTNQIPREMMEGPVRMPSLPIERVCFICLDDNNPADDKLLPCCTRCCAMVHQSCWVNWRRSQSSHARRSRVSGMWSTSDPFMCSICKSGAARLEDEIVSSRWLETFMDVNRSSYMQNANSSGLFLALTRPRSDSDSEDDEEDDVGDIFSLLTAEQDGQKKVLSLPVLVLMITCLFMFGQVVVWRVMDIDSQFLVFALTLTICSAVGVVAGILLYTYQRRKYSNFMTV